MAARPNGRGGPREEKHRPSGSSTRIRYICLFQFSGAGTDQERSTYIGTASSRPTSRTSQSSPPRYLAATVRHLLHNGVLVDRLEVGVMRERAVRQREPQGACDALVCRCGLDDLGGQEEVLLLLFGQDRLIRGADSGRSKQGCKQGKAQGRRQEAKAAHRSRLPAGETTLRL